MLFQIMPDVDVREYANSEPPSGLVAPTTDFFGVQLLQLRQDIAPITQAPREQRSLPRQEVIESLERSITQHADVWSELARP